MLWFFVAVAILMLGVLAYREWAVEDVHQKAKKDAIQKTSDERMAILDAIEAYMRDKPRFDDEIFKRLSTMSEAETADFMRQMMKKHDKVSSLMDDFTRIKFDEHLQALLDNQDPMLLYSDQIRAFVGEAK
jgi:hypothetical protein